MQPPSQALASWTRATDLVYAAGLEVRSLTGGVWHSPRLLRYLWDTLLAGLKGLNKPVLDYDPTLLAADLRNHNLRYQWQRLQHRAQQADVAAGGLTPEP
jgi:hypothetical protein